MSMVLPPTGPGPMPGPPPLQPGEVMATRPPGPEECHVCGSTPARRVVFLSMSGLLVFYQLTRVRGEFCRDCGLNAYHARQRVTLMFGWWHLGGFLAPLFILNNRIRARRFTKLDPPLATPGVLGEAPTPLDPGRKLIPLPWVLGLTLVGVPVALFALLILIGTLAGGRRVNSIRLTP
jgi:hypothetical protein